MSNKGGDMGEQYRIEEVGKAASRGFQEGYESVRALHRHDERPIAEAGALMKRLAKWWYCHVPKWLHAWVYDCTGRQVIYRRITRYGPDGATVTEDYSWNRHRKIA